MSRNVRGAVVVITGASSGIGRAAALAFAQKGASVVVAARREHALDTLVEECQQLGVSALAVPTDVTDADAVERLAQQAEERFGRIDVWINNAGVYLAGRFEDVPPEDFRQLFEVNFFGCVNGCRAALPRVRRQGGVIINTASVAGASAYPYFSAYIASKWAVRGFTSTLRQENLGTNVDVCAVLPASIDTPLFRHAGNYTGWALKAMNPVYTPEMVANAMVMCAEHGTREVIVGGAGRMMAAEFTFMPRVADRLLSFQANKDHFRKDQSAPRTPGNVYEPVAEGTGTSGGWGGSRLPDVVAGVSTIGMAVAAPAVAWLASAGFRDWVGHRLPDFARPRRKSAVQRFGQAARRALA
jgi:NADP-dependent 3-hydroxy acid dehydrogenase YdfG